MKLKIFFYQLIGVLLLVAAAAVVRIVNGAEIFKKPGKVIG